jgi:hypothetical protein
VFSLAERGKTPNFFNYRYVLEDIDTARTTGTGSYTREVLQSIPVWPVVLLVALQGGTSHWTSQQDHRHQAAQPESKAR